MPEITFAPPTFEPDSDQPVQGRCNGPCSRHLISDTGALTQFGAFVEVLPPGPRSSFRQWEEEDEMTYTPAGELVLIEDTKSTPSTSEAACLPADHSMGHCLENRSRTNAIYLIVGSRRQTDCIHYPAHALVTRKHGQTRSYLRMAPHNERPDRWMPQ